MLYVFFFFQAEDGIRDDLVTGVQTCALPICCSGAVQQVWSACPRSVAGSHVEERRYEIRLRNADLAAIAADGGQRADRRDYVAGSASCGAGPDREKACRRARPRSAGGSVVSGYGGLVLQRAGAGSRTTPASR